MRPQSYRFSHPKIFLFDCTKKRRSPTSFDVTDFGVNPQSELSRVVFPEPPAGVTLKGNTFWSAGGEIETPPREGI